MIARRVSVNLKADAAANFTRTVEKEVLPMLRKQKGFKDEITFVAPGGKEAVGISFWDNKENLEAYTRNGYPEALKTLGKVSEGTPQVQIYDVANSTVHHIATGTV
jgi:heme-degrading monooxygenase HmoA